MNTSRTDPEAWNGRQEEEKALCHEAGACSLWREASRDRREVTTDERPLPDRATLATFLRNVRVTDFIADQNEEGKGARKKAKTLFSSVRGEKDCVRNGVGVVGEKAPMRKIHGARLKSAEGVNSGCGGPESRVHRAEKGRGGSEGGGRSSLLPLRFSRERLWDKQRDWLASMARPRECRSRFEGKREPPPYQLLGWTTIIL